MKKLVLVLSGKWFDEIAQGRKRTEYRRDSDWIRSRLDGSPSHVEFLRGYAHGAPRLTFRVDGITFDRLEQEWAIDFSGVV